METSRLRELITAPGDFASVYFDMGPEPRWPEIRGRLEDQGADLTTVQELGQAILAGARPVGTSGRALIASAGRLLLDAWLPVPPATPVVRWSSLPYLLPLAAHNVPPVAYVVVIMDRVGTDLRGYSAHGELAQRATVDGPTELADALSRMVDELNAQLVVIAGDLAELREALPERLLEIVVDTRTAPAEGVDEAALETEVRLIVEDFGRTAQQTWVDDFAAELARNSGLAVQGLEAVTAALREERADTVVVTDQLVADRPLWTAAGLGQITVTAADDTVQRRADEALPAAAAVSGAGLVVPDGQLGLTDGVGALLRT